jgi:subtilisin family serine protease
MKQIRVFVTVWAFVTCVLLFGIGVEVVGSPPEEGGGLLPGIDYVPGDVVVTFSEAYMPVEAGFSGVPPRFSITDLDSLTQAYGGLRIHKLLPSWNRATSNAARTLERSFVVTFDGRQDAREIVEQWSRLPQFERVQLNRIYHIEFYGVPREVPDTSSAFDLQWHLDSESDSLDIDMPEAWAIAKGDPDLVIGIPDEGAMLDTTTTDQEGWKLHSDFNYLWLSAEDHESPGKLNMRDVDCSVNFSDDNNDGVRDNIIGHNYFFGFECSSSDTSDCPDCETSGDEVKEAFYEGFPLNWQLDVCDAGCPPESLFTPISWNLEEYRTHGVHVASLAAGQWEGNDIVGVAPACKVYFVRMIGGGIVHTQDMLFETASHCDVINMSWGIAEDLPPWDLFVEALDVVANDSNVVLVAASGNGGGGSTQVKYPARSQYVLSVGAMAKDLELWPQSSWNTGLELVDVVAPMEDLYSDSHNSTCPDSLPCAITEAIHAGNGTSYAAPQVAGLAALIRSRFPGLNAAQVRQRIKDSAEYYWSSDSQGKKKYGAGKINAYRALTEWDTISVNTTWGAMSGMPDTLYVSGDLVIDTGVTLTLNKGAVVRVSPDNEKSGSDTARVQILVNGTLKTGTGGSGPIVFESFTDTAGTRCDWVGIKFASTSTNNVLDGVTIRNAQVAIENHAPVTLTNCVIEQCETGIESHDDLTVSISTIKYVTDAGIKIDDGDAELYGVTIKEDSLHGLWVRRSSDTVNLKDSWILNCVNGVFADSIEAVAGGGVTVRRSVFHDNEIAFKCDSSNVVVDSTEIVDNTKGVTTLYGANPDLGHASGGSSQGYNVIHHQSSYYVQNLTSNTIMAEQNWFGRVAPPASKFYGSVDYTPRLTGSDPPDIYPHQEPGESSPFLPGYKFPVAYDLSYNYPNPFNPTTRIQYDVPAPGALVRLVVYNVSGQAVKTLVHERKSPGVYTATWDGTSERGETVATGIYFVRMEAGTFRQTRKLVLLK